MEMKDYNLTCGEVIDNLLTLADAYEKASAGKAPSGFAFNPTDAAANMKAAVHFIGSFGQQVPQWIPVEEKWPPHLSDVLVAYKCGKYVRIGVGEFDGTTVNDEGITIPYFKGIHGFEVTHWMPLPELPAE